MDDVIVAIILTSLPMAAWIAVRVLGSSREKKRLAELADFAEKRGFRFEHRSETTDEQGVERILENRLQGESDGLPVQVFDVRLASRAAHHRWALVQTVVELSSPVLRLPSFRIEPENVIHKVQEAMGAQDIDFDSHPHFSDRYLLRGDSEQEIRKAFTPAVLEWFEQHLGLTVEAAGGRLTLFRSGKLLFPEQIEQELRTARELHDVFARAS